METQHLFFLKFFINRSDGLKENKIWSAKGPRRHRAPEVYIGLYCFRILRSQPSAGYVNALHMERFCRWSAKSYHPSAVASAAAAADKMSTNLLRPRIRVTLLICDKNIVTTFTN